MLDKSSKKILKYFVNECGEGNYKIFDIDEIISECSAKQKTTKETMRLIISHLERGEYISVKYSDDEQYCITTLPFGRQFIETEETQEQNKKVLLSLVKKNNFLTMFFAFLGSFLGTLLYYLVIFFK